MEQKVSQEIFKAFSLIKEKKFFEAERLLQDNLQKKDPQKEPVACALLYSTLGFLNRARGEMKAAWRMYEQAEKQMPKDPSLKIIMARFLIEEFSQYGTALKKAKTGLKLAEGIPSLEHQARTVIGLAHLKKGNKKKAVQALKLLLEIGFEEMISAENIDFTLIEALLHRNLERDLCQQYVQKGLEFARGKNEKRAILIMQKLLEGIKEAA
ncbi:MAG: hypothetical protein Q7S00_01430 [bacterium]|nr:hypothetical protein [bacterium]